MKPERKRRVLVVDDDGLLRTVLNKILVQNGYEVHCAVDGQDALRAVPKFRPDLVLLDVMMPKENGYRVSRMIKTLAKSSGLRTPSILILTARKLDGDHEREHAVLEYSKADGMAYKPYDPIELLERIDGMLGVFSAADPERGAIA